MRAWGPWGDAPIDAIATGPFLREAFLETAADRAALPMSELIHLSFDVGIAANIAIACAKRIEPLMGEIAKLELDHELIERLDVYGRAARYAQAVYGLSTAPPEALQAVYELALRYRAALYSDLVNLARGGLVDAEAVKQIKNEVGFRNVADDLVRLVELFLRSKERIAGRTVTQPEDVSQAEVVATQLIELAAYREQNRHANPDIAEQRLRAVSLMVKAYEQARRAVLYLRFDHGDADEFAPSIYTARGTRRREAPPEASSGGSVAAPSAEQSAQVAVSEQPKVPGGPGGDPLM